MPKTEKKTDVILFASPGAFFNYPDILFWEIDQETGILYFVTHEDTVVRTNIPFTLSEPSQEDVDRMNAIKAMNAKEKAKDAGLILGNFDS